MNFAFIAIGMLLIFLPLLVGLAFVFRKEVGSWRKAFVGLLLYAVGIIATCACVIFGIYLIARTLEGM